MTTWIAERRLLFARKGDSKRRALLIRIGQPYLLEKGTVNFEFHDGAAGCLAEFVGLDDSGLHKTYGADSLQALQLAVDIEPVLRALRSKYDFFFSDGEPYFDAGENG